MHVRCPARVPEGTYREVLDLLGELSSVVQALPPSAALVELKGALRYHGMPPQRLGEVLRLRSVARIGVDVRVGIGSSVTVAATASAQITGPGGVLVVEPGTEAEWLAPLPVDALHGIGPRQAQTAGRVAKAVGVLLETAPATEDGELVSVVDAWAAIEKAVPREKLAEALAVIAEVVPDEEGDEDAEWRAALATRYGTVRGFIRLLVDVVDFGAVEAGAPVVKALKQLPHLIHRKKLPADEVERELVTGSWRRLVFAAPGIEPGLADKAAYSFCVLEQLHRALRRRDVYARSGDRWGDPRAKLLAGDRWESAQPTVLTALGLEAEPAAHLAELAGALHGAYHQVVAGLPTNSAVSVKNGKLVLDRLGPAAEPKLMPAFRQLANGMLPKVDFPELLLEVADLTGMTTAFTHISGADPSMEEFELSVCALLLSEACNVGLTPVVKPNVPALTRGREARASGRGRALVVRGG
ncbi:Tn3 family transposase [Streptomyces sp. NPDC001073]